MMAPLLGSVFLLKIASDAAMEAALRGGIPPALLAVTLPLSAALACKLASRGESSGSEHKSVALYAAGRAAVTSINLYGLSLIPYSFYLASLIARPAIAWAALGCPRAGRKEAATLVCCTFAPVLLASGGMPSTKGLLCLGAGMTGYSQLVRYEAANLKGPVRRVWSTCSHICLWQAGGHSEAGSVSSWTHLALRGG